MVVSDVKYWSKTMLLSPINNEILYSNGYQSLTVIITNVIDSGNNNVSLEQMFTTLIIISLVAARVLAIQR